MALIRNSHIDCVKSLHCKQIQRSEYVKIDDNLIEFDFDRRFGIKGTGNPNLKPLTDDEIRTRKDELNRVQIKYLSMNQVAERKNFIMAKKIQFLTKMNNLKNKGDMIQKLE